VIEKTTQTNFMYCWPRNLL